MAGFMLVIFGGLALRLTQLSWWDSEHLVQRAQRQYARTIRTVASRGTILDAYGDRLAIAVQASSIYARSGRRPLSAEDHARLADALEIGPDVLDRKLGDSRRFTWLVRRAPRRMAQRVASLGLADVEVVPEARRYYPRRALAAHVLGIAGQDLKGLEGVELEYNDWMRGDEVEFHVSRDGLGRPLFRDGLSPADPNSPRRVSFPGASLELTIDAGLQALAERELRAGVLAANADAGIVIALDPRTGAIRALANHPTYDPNHPGQFDASTRRNRAITDSYEPGSTFKAVLAAAAVEEGVVEAEEEVWCEEGRYKVGRWTIRDHHPYKFLTLPDMIRYSSNIGVSKVAERLGRDRYADYVERFGFGRRTAIDLPGEAAGIVRPRNRWAKVDLATSSFGQGIAVTPIQLAAAFGAIANGGRMHQPYVLERATDSAGAVLHEWTPTKRHANARDVIRPHSARRVVEMLESVVAADGGTGARARVAGVRVAGKTGTAEKADRIRGGYSKERLASFVGFAPAEGPELVVLVMIDNPRGKTYGGVVAAPVFSRIMSRALDRAGVRRAAPTLRPAEDLDGDLVPELTEVALPTADLGNEPLAEPGFRVPSFIGLSLRSAMRQAQERGLRAEPWGRGFVVAQDPPAGATSLDGRVLLELEPQV